MSVDILVPFLFFPRQRNINTTFIISIIDIIIIIITIIIIVIIIINISTITIIIELRSFLLVAKETKNFFVKLFFALRERVSKFQFCQSSSVEVIAVVFAKSFDICVV